MRKVTLLAATALIAASSAARAELVPTDTGVAIMDQFSGNPGGPDVGFNDDFTDPFQWQNHQTIEWSFSFDGKDTLTFTFGTAISKLENVHLEGVEILGVTGFLANQTKDSTLPDDLKLTIDINDAGGIDYLPMFVLPGAGLVPFQFIGGEFGKTWTIKGTAVADWTGPLGPNSAGKGFGFGIAGLVGELPVDDVPEPATLGLFGLGALGLGIARRRKRA